jgi:hypothetical protein
MLALMPESVYICRLALPSTSPLSPHTCLPEGILDVFLPSGIYIVAAALSFWMILGIWRWRAALPMAGGRWLIAGNVSVYQIVSIFAGRMDAG